MSTSEVAQLRRRIELELEAMHRHATSFALGTARHEFIRLRMERIGTCQDQLIEQVGEREATQMLCTLYVSVLEPQ